VETILGFAARLYKVGQLSYGHARVTRAPFITCALEENRLGRYHQDTTMAGRYGAEVYIRGTVVPLQHRRRPHLNTQRKGTLPKRLEKEQTVVMTCRPNSKQTPLTDVYLIFVLCSLFFAPLCTGFNFKSV
jgi:hypothetical protein